MKRFKSPGHAGDYSRPTTRSAISSIVVETMSLLPPTKLPEHEPSTSGQRCCGARGRAAHRRRSYAYDIITKQSLTDGSTTPGTAAFQLS
jgi:hypothetical protein